MDSNDLYWKRQNDKIRGKHVREYHFGIVNDITPELNKSSQKTFATFVEEREKRRLEQVKKMDITQKRHDRVVLEEHFEKFVEDLRKNGRDTFALRYMNEECETDYRLKDIKFSIANVDTYADEYNEAITEFSESIEKVAVELSTGVLEEDVYYQGEVIGSKKIYSEKILELLLKGNMKEKYGQNSTGKGSGAGNVTVVLNDFSDKTFNYNAPPPAVQDDDTVLLEGEFEHVKELVDGEKAREAEDSI